MLTDPVNEKEECRFRGMAGFSHNLLRMGMGSWFIVGGQRPYCGSQHDNTRPKTKSPKGKRYAY